MIQYELIPWGVHRLDTGEFIPNDSSNAQWVIFQQWVLQGNLPLPLNLSKYR